VKRKLIAPWWELVGIHSIWQLQDGSFVWDIVGWQLWADEEDSPPLHSLNKRKKRHLRYA